VIRGGGATDNDCPLERGSFDWHRLKTRRKGDIGLEKGYEVYPALDPRRSPRSESVSDLTPTETREK
jgi:hypothetical protein